MSTLKSVYLGKIRPSVVALRPTDRESESFRKLVDTCMTKPGLVPPLMVVEKNNGYEVVDGNRRYWAWKETAKNWIRVNIVDLDSEQILVSQIRMAKFGDPVDDEDIAMHLKRLLSYDPCHTMQSMSLLVGLSKERIKDLLLKSLDNYLIGNVYDGDILLINAIALAKLPTLEQRGWRDRAWTLMPDVFIPRVNQRLKELGDKYGRTEDDKIRPPHNQPMVKRAGWDNVTVDGQIAYVRGDVLIRWSGELWTVEHPDLKLDNYGDVEYLMELVEATIK